MSVIARPQLSERERQLAGSPVAALVADQKRAVTRPGALRRFTRASATLRRRSLLGGASDRQRVLATLRGSGRQLARRRLPHPPESGGRRDDPAQVTGDGCATGEWEVRGDARAETRFHFRTGITSVAPRMVVSGSDGQLVRSLTWTALMGLPMHRRLSRVDAARFAHKRGAGRRFCSLPSKEWNPRVVGSRWCCSSEARMCQSCRPRRASPNASTTLDVFAGHCGRLWISLRGTRRSSTTLEGLQWFSGSLLSMKERRMTSSAPS
jgi:hypothetical protein